MANFEIKHATGTPLQIVEYALTDPARPPENERSNNDRTWCVFDVEAPVRHPRIAQALRLAEENDINCAVSNPCFEIWPILHLKDQKSYLTTRQAEDLLDVLHEDYSPKQKDLNYQAIKPYYPLARRRAQVLLNSGEPTADITARNPYSSVWELVETLQKMGRKQASKPRPSRR